MDAINQSTAESKRLRRILVVDDDDLLLTEIVACLKSRGFETAVAADGEEGLAQCKDFRPDLVVLDLMMPMTDGFQVCRQLKQASGKSRPKIILLSGVTSEHRAIIESLLQRALADSYLPKPFRPTELMAAIDKLLAASEREPAAGE